MQHAAARALRDVIPGSHMCVFYETKDDLLDLVLPFFHGGTARGELCVWMMPEHVSADEVALRARDEVAGRHLELHRGRDLYLKGNCFEREPVVCYWNEKLEQALSTRRQGLRVSGDTYWLEQRNWSGFLDYENGLNSVIANRPITVLCTYPLSVSKAGDIFDVVRAHHVAIAKRGDAWDVLEAPGLRDANEEAVEAADRVATLTLRERQVLDGVIDGHASKVIAHQLGISVRTIEVHRARILDQLGVGTMAEAVRLATLARLIASEMMRAPG